MNAISSIAAATSEFLRDPDSVGSVFPASSYMVRRTLAPIEWNDVDLMVEFGPGTGRFTFEALARMKPSARLLAIEPGEAFVDHLRSTSHDARLIVVKGEAQQVRDIMDSYGFAQASCILSGIPFSTIEPGDAITIAERSRQALGRDGMFVAYQMRRKIEHYLERRFKIARRGYALWNIPPCHLYWATPAKT